MLTGKQQLFVDEYLKCWNATEAARRAGYAGGDNTLAVTGYDNLRNPKISDIIQRRLQESAMSADEVLRRLSDMARADIAEFADVERPADLHLDEYHGKTHVIKKFKRKITRDQLGRQFEEIELELYPADSALVNIGKQHGLFADKRIVDLKVEKEVSGILDVLEQVLDSDNYKRALAALGGSETGPTEVEPGSEDKPI